MAPSWPEEVDVFSVPHSRMKTLVHKYSDMITTTDFRDERNLTTLLENLLNVFSEFKAHEQIENMLIMRKLRSKLKAACVTSAAVCNCHSDNRLTDMLDLVADGYKWAHKTSRERQAYGRKLRHALEDFTQNFIPHMEEEEEVFQPMLMQYFSYEELKELKDKVIREHYIPASRGPPQHEKCVADSCESDISCDEGDKKKEDFFHDLPNEICQKIFSYLGPKDLARIGQVSQRWNSLAKDPLMWSKLYPVHWAQGNWSFFPQPVGGVDGVGFGHGSQEQEEADSYVCMDEDADVDDSSDSDEPEHEESENLKQILKEAKMITAIVKHLLPHVGQGVKVCDLAYSRGLSSSLVHKILKLCPNLEVLDLTHTKVGDDAFKECGVSGRMSKLRHLDLTGCENITDLTLFSLSCAGEEGRAGEEGEHVEIENLPALCPCKVSTCCQRRPAPEITPTKSLEANVICCPNTTKSLEANVICCPSTTKLLEANVICCPSGGGRCVEKPTTASPPAVSRVSSEDCDLSYVYLDMLIESDGNLLTQNSSTSVSSDFSMFCLTEELQSFNFDPDICTDHAGLDRPPTPRTLGCGGSGLILNTCDTRGQDINIGTFHSSKPGNGVKAGVDVGQSLENKVEPDEQVCKLEYLSLNGCYRISDAGLCALARGRGTPHLSHLDISGCISVSGYGLSTLVSTCTSLDHANLYYCDFMPDDPYPTTASGCRNLQCHIRFCCSGFD